MKSAGNRAKETKETPPPTTNQAGLGTQGGGCRCATSRGLSQVGDGCFFKEVTGVGGGGGTARRPWGAPGTPGLGTGVSGEK